MTTTGYSASASSGSSDGGGHLLGLIGQEWRHLLGHLGRQHRPLLDEPTAGTFIVILLPPPPFLDGSLDDAMRALEEEEALRFTSW
jgi:hypothetical protein